MKAKFLPIFLCLVLAGCGRVVVKEPPCMADYDKHITFVDSIRSGSKDLLLTTYGVCHMNDFWSEFPIEVKKMNVLDILFSGKSVSWVIDHEKAHRFEAVQIYGNPQVWEEFEVQWNEQFGEYDPEDFANMYAELRRRGIKDSKQQFIYDFMTKKL